jgi:hypothetical protein
LVRSFFKVQGAFRPALMFGRALSARTTGVNG